MKFLLKLVLFLSITIVILLVGTGFWLRTEKGIKIATNFLTDYIEKQTNNNYKITITNPRFSFPLVLEAQEVTLKERDEELITIQKFCINILPSLLWLRNLTIWDISAEQIILSKIPKTLNSEVAKKKEKEGEETQYYVPNIDIQNIAVDEIILSPVITGLKENLKFNIAGNLSFNSSDKQVNFKGKISKTKAVILSDNKGTNSKAQALEEQDEIPAEAKLQLKRGTLALPLESSSDFQLSLLDQITLDIKAKYNLNNSSFNISEFKLSAPHSAIEGDLEVNTQTNLVIGQLRFHSSALEFIFPQQKSLFEGRGDISGTISATEIKVEGTGYLTGENDCYFKLPKTNFAANIMLAGNDGNGKFSLASEGIKAGGEIEKKDQQLHFKHFKIKGNNFNSEANLVFDNESKMITGEFNASSNNINELKAFFPFIQKGAVEIKAKYFGKENRQVVNINSKIKHLSTSFFNCNLAEISLWIKDLTALQMERADIKIKSLIHNKVSIRDLTLNAKTKGDSVSFESYIKSVDPYPFNLKAIGVIQHFNQNNESTRKENAQTSFIYKGNYHTQITSNINGAVGKLPVENLAAIVITIGNRFKSFYLQAPNVKVKDGKLDINLALDDSNLRGELNITNFPAMIFPGVLPEVFTKSFISGALTINATDQSTVFNSALEIGGIELIKKNPSYAILKLSTKLANNCLLVDSEIIREKQVLASFNAQVPYKLLLFPLQAEVIAKEPLNATLKINQETNVLALIPTPPGHKLLGYAKGQLQVSGSYEAPQINGSINVDRTEYKYKAYGIKLKKISANIVAQNSNIKVSNFIAKDVSANIVMGEGKLAINGEVPFMVNLKTDKFSFINTPYVQGEIKGQLKIVGNIQKALAKGSFGLGPMEFKIPEHFSDNIPSLNIIETLNQNNIIYSPQKKPYTLELDIDLLPKQQVYVRGWGVNTLLDGELKIKNEITEPYIFGKLRSIRGTYQEFGKVLTVKEGVLIFDGPLSPSPYINIIGVTFVDGEEIRLILSGSIFNPDIKLESSGSSSSQEALSKLLFGKNPESITTMQALALADGMRRVSGHGGGFDPMGLGRKILGVDDISLKNNEDTDKPSIGVGKYLTDKIYLEVEQGDDISGAKTRIEVQITSKITIEGVTSAKGNSTVGINWRFDY